MINISKLDLTKNPFWYIKKKEIIDGQLFQNLKKIFLMMICILIIIRKILLEQEMIYIWWYEKLLNRSESWKIF